MEHKKLNIQLSENATESVSDNDSGNQLDRCGSCCSITSREIEAFSNMLQIKDNRITDVEDKLSELAIKLSVYKERQRIHNEKIKDKDDLIAALSLDSSSIKAKLDKLVEIMSKWTNMQCLIQDLTEQNAQACLVKTSIDTTLTNPKPHAEVDERIIEQLKSTIAELESKVKENDKQLRSATTKLSKYEDSIRISINYGTSDKIMYVPGIKPFLVTLEDKIAGPGWVVIHRRLDGTVDFNRDFTKYQEGFGNPYGEFWLGLEKLHKITENQTHHLYISIVAYNNKSSYAHYESFAIGNKDEGYYLKSLGKYSGNAGDSMWVSEKKQFSICPKKKRGWWDSDFTYPNCNPNGKFSKYEMFNDWNTLYWGVGGQYGEICSNVLSIQMMIKPSAV